MILSFIIVDDDNDTDDDGNNNNNNNNNNDVKYNDAMEQIPSLIANIYSRKPQHFMEPGNLLLHSQASAICLRTKPDKSNPRSPSILILEYPFNIHNLRKSF